MKLKLTDHGWQAYTGFLGAIEFVDGVTVEDIPFRDATRIAGNIQAIDIATGLSPSATETMLERRLIAIPNAERFETAAEADAKKAAKVGAAPAEDILWTRETLEALADKEGIKGVRAVADKFGVKSNSIAGLIDETLQVQASKRKPASGAEPAPIEQPIEPIGPAEPIDPAPTNPVEPVDPVETLGEQAPAA